MFGYDYKFTDIQKHAVTDLTDEQIQELVNALQTKRNEKPELTKEEKAFFQCCREHRNYANNKDFLHHYIDNEEHNKEELLKYVERGALKSQEKFSNTLNGMDTKKIIEVLNTLHEQQKKKRGISDQQVCCLSCVDTNNNHFLQIVCVGRIQPTHIEQTLVPHITEDTVLVTDSHRAYKTVANKYKIPLNQIPSGKHTSGGFHLGHINGYHHNISDFMYLYHGVSSKFLDYYLALFYWVEKNKSKTYLEQAYDIITLLVNQTMKILLDKFKYKTISFDTKRLAI